MTDKLKAYLKKVIDELNVSIVTDDIIIEIPKDNKNGDYSSNVAMKLARVLKKNPMVIAQEIISNINEKEIIKVEAVNPGFINFYLDKSYLFENINNILIKKENYGKSDVGHGKKINIEFSQKNSL